MKEKTIPYTYIITFRLRFNDRNHTQFDSIYELREYLEKKIKNSNIKFKHGKVNRKTELQMEYEEASSYIKKERKYLNHLNILKEDMQLRRGRYRGHKKARLEFLLLALGYNLRKYVHKKEHNRQGMKLHKVN